MMSANDVEARVGDRAKNFSRAMETAFWDQFEGSQKELLNGQSPDESIKRMETISNGFLDLLCCTTVGLMTRVGDTSEAYEEAVISNVRRWFKNMREHEKRSAR